MADWFAPLAKDAAAPDGLAEWSQSQPSFDDAWRSCARPDWMLWLASRRQPPPSADRLRVIVASACQLTEHGHRLPAGLLRPTVNEVELAAEWANPGEADQEFRLGDLFNAIAVSALVVMPLATLLIFRWRSVYVWLRALYIDLITFPAVAVVYVVSYFLLHRFRLQNLRARLTRLTPEQALDTSLAAVARAVPTWPEADRLRSANLLRLTWKE